MSDSGIDRDPRVYFAAERTLLAWIRTALTLMGFGFVVARFGLFLRMLHPEQSGGHAFSVVVGVTLVLLGVLTAGAAAIQHRRFTATLSAAQLPAHVSMRFPVMLAWALCLIGLMLAAYLST